MVIGSIYLVILRRDSLRSDAQLDSLFSREAVFLFQNLVLVALAAVVFWVTFFPLISEAITGTQVSVGPPAFRPFVVPLALSSCCCPASARSSPGAGSRWPSCGAALCSRWPSAVALVALLFVSGVAAPAGYVMFVLGAFVVASVVQEFYRGVRARRAMTSASRRRGAAGLVARNRRRYGGYIVHAGVAVALVGVAASTSFQHQRTATLKPGQSVRTDGYTSVRPRDRQRDPAEDLVWRGAGGDEGRASRDDAAHQLRPVSRRLTRCTPIGRFFNGSDESQVGLHSGPLRDLWVVISPNIGPATRRSTRATCSWGGRCFRPRPCRRRSGRAAQPALHAPRPGDPRARPAVRQPSVVLAVPA